MIGPLLLLLGLELLVFAGGFAVAVLVVMARVRAGWLEYRGGLYRCVCVTPRMPRDSHVPEQREVPPMPPVKPPKNSGGRGN